MGLSWKNRVLTVLLGVAAASGLTTLILFLVEATRILLPADSKFGIVFDAGSSHTSLFVYKWPADKENNTGVVSQALACQVEGPGISSYTSNPALAGESLRGCLEEALALIPKAQHWETPTFLGATAGMRLLSQKNGSQAERIFAEVARVLRQSPVDFRSAALLTGLEEGAFAWITINYALGMLLTYTFSGEWARPPEATLVGALDMGGASTQLSFVPGGPILDPSTQASVLLYGSSYNVYTHSYLCFGRDQVLSRLLARLVQGSSSGLVRHPCYHSGYQATLPLAPLFESPCVGTSAPAGTAQNLTIEGAGNPGACVSAIRELFNFSSCEGRADCAFDGVYQPPVRGQFYVEVSYPEQAPWLRDYCASGLYILTLLLEGYGFSEETWPSINFRMQAGGTDIGWTLGYMLNLTNMIPAKAPITKQAESYGVWMATIVLVALTLGAILGAVAVQLLWPWN
ncbi:ectonucleoside triphosphate diphosphohydrolase 8 isoform X2 [Trichechus manatus latirostris]|uniref:Ectonucleoside triphosphate diphosphohydrolase 8 n=1 Tax=Trichechus manatus latirostris TaxID=127582 RepID=A0A2Y9QPW5_TRIMA|nr:ectonucleoside triphosphate diphosphohydrolase 8 isoform X2 [Trichechus manatus latirostris]